MLRTTIGLSFILVLGGLAACSSKAIDDDTSGGKGAIVGIAGNSAGGSSTGGGNPSTTGGTRATGGTTSTAGTAGTTGACTDADITCADDTNAKACNPTTGELETFNCIDEYATLGFVSTGCSLDETGEGCDVTDVKDAGCQMGAQAYAFCAGASTDEELFNIYVNCFQDYMGAHTIVPCFAEYVSETMTTDADCEAAVDACFGAGGAGPGDTGAGGAP